MKTVRSSAWTMGPRGTARHGTVDVLRAASLLGLLASALALVAAAIAHH